MAPSSIKSALDRDLQAIDWGRPSRLPPDGWHAMTPSDPVFMICEPKGGWSMWR